MAADIQILSVQEWGKWRCFPRYNADTNTVHQVLLLTHENIFDIGSRDAKWSEKVDRQNLEARETLKKLHNPNN
jgi:hypothetical protein